MLHKILNHFIRTVVKDQRGAWSWGGAGGGAAAGFAAGGAIGGPIGAGIGTMAGGILGGFAGGGKKEQYDPLANIRKQLQDLAGQVPGLTARRKELIADLFKTAGEEGKKGIQEFTHAERGFGASTMELDLERKLLADLAKGQTGAELEAELGGINLEAGLLGQAAGMYPPEDTTPSFGTQLMGMGGKLLGEEIGYNRLKDLFGTDDLFNIPGKTPDYTGSYGGGSFQEEFKKKYTPTYTK